VGIAIIDALRDELGVDVVPRVPRHRTERKAPPCWNRATARRLVPQTTKNAPKQGSGWVAPEKIA